jgi:hypothetical protein
LIKSFRRRPLLARSISLDSTFKPPLFLNLFWLIAQARSCKKNGTVYSVSEGECYDALTQGPCEGEEEWFVAVKGQLHGICQERHCLVGYYKRRAKKLNLKTSK